MHWVSEAFIVAGAAVFAIAALGLLRLRDVFSRSSAVATAAGLGISLILTGVFLRDPSWAAAVKLVAAVLLQLCTSAIGSMAIARSAYLTGSPMIVGETGVDELQQAGDEPPPPPS